MKLQCTDPDAPVEKCLNCGKNIHTCERTVAINNDYRCPVHKDGFETNDGKWFCSSGCYDQYFDAELSRVDKQMTGYFPIEDNNSNFDLVEIKTTHPNVNKTPHCKIHGAMNCVAVHSNGKLWRCIQSNQLKDCRAGCEEKI